MAFLPFAKTIFKSLTQKASTQAYPAAEMPKDPLVRGHVEIDIGSCIFCGICEKKCPTHAITVDKAGRTWGIGQFECIVCGACTEGCPKKCLRMDPKLTPASGEKTRTTVTSVAADA